MALPPGGRPERRSYLFRCEPAPFEEAGLADPLAVVGGDRLPKSLRSRPRRVLAPELLIPVDGLLRRLIAYPPPAKLVANAPGAMAATEARGGVLLGEALLAQEPLRFQRVEDPVDFVNVSADGSELERELSAGVLAAREQLQGPRPKLPFVLTGQASTASPASSAARLRLGSSRSRRAVSIERAICSFSLRNSRTLSRPWPIRSPS